VQVLKAALVIRGPANTKTVDNKGVLAWPKKLFICGNLCKNPHKIKGKHAKQKENLVIMRANCTSIKEHNNKSSVNLIP
jgi:hypothetical protein